MFSLSRQRWAEENLLHCLPCGEFSLAILSHSLDGGGGEGTQGRTGKEEHKARLKINGGVALSGAPKKSNYLLC